MHLNFHPRCFQSSSCIGHTLFSRSYFYCHVLSTSLITLREGNISSSSESWLQRGQAGATAGWGGCPRPPTPPLGLWAATVLAWQEQWWAWQYLCYALPVFLNTFKRGAVEGKVQADVAPRQVKKHLDLHKHLPHYISTEFLRFWGGWRKSREIRWRKRGRKRIIPIFNFDRENNVRAFGESKESHSHVQNVPMSISSNLSEKKTRQLCNQCEREGIPNKVTFHTWLAVTVEKPKGWNETLTLILINYPHSNVELHELLELSYDFWTQSCWSSVLEFNGPKHNGTSWMHQLMTSPLLWKTHGHLKAGFECSLIGFPLLSCATTDKPVTGSFPINCPLK